MNELKVQERQVVTPGEAIATGLDYLPSNGTYRHGQEIRAGYMGLVQLSGKVVKVIPLSGRYSPKVNDMIIAKVVDISLNGWRLELNSPYSAMMQLKEATSEFIQKGADLSSYYDFNDYVVCNIIQVTTQKLVDISMRGPGLKKLVGGRIIEVNPHKVPRIIGKQGSMVEMVKQYTGTNIIVGQNGWVHVQGNNVAQVALACAAIKKIENESHISGLTDKMKSWLEQSAKDLPQ